MFMLMSTRGTLAAAALMLVMATATTAAESQASYNRPATVADLPGLWKVVQWSTFVDQSKLNSYAEPYQWYLFDNNGSLRFMTSRQPNEDAARIRQTIESLPAVIRYACSGDGKVQTTRTDLSGAEELWQAFYVTRDTSDATGKVDLRAGDIVMTLLDSSGNPLYVRQMRSLDAAPPPAIVPH